MKLYSILLLFLLIGFISARVKEELLGKIIKVLTCPQTLNRTLNLDVKKINVHFYDFRDGSSKMFKDGSGQMFTINDAAKNILSLKKLNKSKKFFMYVGGFRSYINERNSERMRQAFRYVPNSYLLIIDHSAYTNDNNGLQKSYERSVKYVYSIGRQLAQLLVSLQKGGIPAKNIHCIGHSLGAQMLGHTGNFFFKATGQKIARITGLDPAGPCYSKSPVSEQIRSGVAQNVEVYHCNAGALGTSSIIADANFFVNNGKSQPDCKVCLVPKCINPSVAPTCNHRMCVIIWIASITDKYKYKAYKCDNYHNLKTGQCDNNTAVTAGFWNPGTVKGVYYFSTKGYDFN